MSDYWLLSSVLAPIWYSGITPYHMLEIRIQAKDGSKITLPNSIIQLNMKSRSMWYHACCQRHDT